MIESVEQESTGLVTAGTGELPRQRYGGIRIAIVEMLTGPLALETEKSGSLHEPIVAVELKTS